MFRAGDKRNTANTRREQRRVQRESRRSKNAEAAARASADVKTNPTPTPTPGGSAGSAAIEPPNAIPSTSMLSATIPTLTARRIDNTKRVLSSECSMLPELASIVCDYLKVVPRTHGVVRGLSKSVTMNGLTDGVIVSSQAELTVVPMSGDECFHSTFRFLQNRTLKGACSSRGDGTFLAREQILSKGSDGVLWFAEFDGWTLAKTITTHPTRLFDGDLPEKTSGLLFDANPKKSLMPPSTAYFLNTVLVAPHKDSPFLMIVSRSICRLFDIAASDPSKALVATHRILTPKSFVEDIASDIHEVHPGRYIMCARRMNAEWGAFTDATIARIDISADGENASGTWLTPACTTHWAPDDISDMRSWDNRSRGSIRGFGTLWNGCVIRDTGNALQCLTTDEKHYDIRECKLPRTDTRELASWCIFDDQVFRARLTATPGDFIIESEPMPSFPPKSCCSSRAV